MRVRTPLAVTALAALSLLAGCTVGPSQRPPVAVRGDSLPAPAAVPTPTEPAAPELPDLQPQQPTIQFVDCTPDVLATMRVPVPAGRNLHIECGELPLPVQAGPVQPDAQQTALTVLRVGLAGAPTNRPPLLVVGDTAVDPTARAAVTMATQLPLDVLDHFTLVGLDRRGAGSDLLDCAPTDVRNAVVDADPTNTAPAVLDRLLESARDVVQECNLNLDGGLGGFRTAATSTDIEGLRRALGVDRLSGIGTGDGAAALGQWARVVPQAAGRVVLDGPPQPGLADPDLAADRARATEAAFDAYATTCRSTGCPLAPDPRAAVNALIDGLRAHPLALADGRTLTAGSAMLALRLGLSEPQTWPQLSAALAAARTGDPRPLLATLDPVLGPRGSYDTMLATACNDNDRRLAPTQIAEAADRMRRTAPLFAGPAALQMLACAPWPAGGTPPQAVAPVPPPPVLVIGTNADPRSTLEGARRAAAELPGAQFVSWQGAGTGAYPRTPCVTGVVDAMLVDGRMPRTSMLCPP